MTPEPRNGQPDRQTAIVVKALFGKDHLRENPMGEIRDLAVTAGVDVLDCFSQRLDRPHPATYLGKGKVEEASRRARELDVDVIITDNELSPAQERNLEKISGRTIIDRNELIMDIFAQRAKTHQAKLQVELAQLRYSLPRLKRLWTHLSRYEGGIGMRGPGETQLETDKRIIARRIQRIVRELKVIERRKEASVDQRRNEFVVALVGYTNAGKSTLLNRLTHSRERVEDKLFATLDTRVRRWELSPNRYVLLTDTVGFIRELPHHLIASFHATLAETREADILLHVVDASSSDAPWQIESVRAVLRELEVDDKPTWLVLNKWDAVSPEKVIDARSLQFQGAASAGRLGTDGLEDPRCVSHTVSARTGEGLDELGRDVLRHLKRQDSELELAVPHDRGDVMAFIRENAEVREAEYGPKSVQVRFRISPARKARLSHMFPQGFPPPAKAPWE